ncbi:NUDIX hydrolase domain-like protein [Tuber brumale]|nr:NUDIX hydrolase domain-like protein [Tuber brumale]
MTENNILHKTTSGATYPSTLSHLNISPPDLLPTIPPVTFLAVGAFLFRKSQLTDAPLTLLLIRRAVGELSFPGLWEIPGGGVEPYETILDAVVREVKEETGLVVGKITQCYDVDDFKGWRSGSAIRKWQFEVEIEGEGEEVVVLDPAEHDEFRWVREEEVQELAITTEGHRGVIMNGFRLRKASIPAIEGKGIDPGGVGV